MLLMGSVIANAQSLKDALYGGKLKNDSGSVVHKTDDLKTKIDSTKKKPVEPEKKQVATIIKDSTGKSIAAGDSVKFNPVTSNNVDVVAPAKTNTQIWKTFIDSAIATLKRDVLPDKKIKSGTYYVLVDYDINEDGQVVINNATPDPADRFLQEQVRQALEAGAPKMAPVLSNGKPKKVSKKYNFILTK